MKQKISELNIETYGEGFVNITSEIKQWISEEKINSGLLLIFCSHTSCSLIINENADPNVLKDLNNYMKALVPQEKFQSIDGSGKVTRFLHHQEGPDDMPAHIKNMLTSTSLNFSVNNSKLVLGTWQAVYLWEHRMDPKRRKLHLHFIGDII